MPRRFDLASHWALGLSLAALTPCLDAQSTVVTPTGYDNAEGNANNIFPWNRGTSSMRIQFVYDSSHFTGQNINFPILISGVKYRADDTTSSWTGGSWPNVQIDMASCPLDYAAVSTTFAQNLNNDLLTVHNGSVTVQAGTGNGNGVPGPWHIDIPFATPFLYDPSLGNDLTIDIYLDGTGWSGQGTACDHVSSSGNPPPLCSRIYSTSGTGNPTGTITNNYGAVCEFTYNPANGLFAGFTADVTTGPSPLTVNFTDTSFSSAAGGVTSWAWDFDNDGTIDSTAQNPTHTFTNCGAYDVALTVTDATNPPSTVVRSGYIVTDLVTADFTDQLIAPLVVQFTDTSTGNPTAWDWDLDGDGTTDATGQNPAFAYPNANPVTVTLTASRLCGPVDTITKTIVPAQQLTTTFADNNGLSASGATIYYDLDVLNNKGISISSFDVNSNSTANQALTIEVYLTHGTYVGNDQRPEAWVLIGSASGTTAGRGLPSPMAFPNPVYIPPGDYGVAMHYLGAGMAYTNGNGTNQQYGNGDLALDLGISRSTSPNAPFGSGGTNNPRVWNGTIYYDTFGFSGAAGYGEFGVGCAGTSNTATLTPSGAPMLGTTLTVTVDNLPLNAAIMMTGFSTTNSALGPLPLSTAPFGAPGCELRVSPDTNLFIAGAGNSADWVLPIPNSPALAGVLFYNQAIVVDPTANAAGAVASNAAGCLLGN
ncbi:MAG: PKD domain-containing protein [bacterium]|nr:PKD domain-containing protein [bacterium]